MFLRSAAFLFVAVENLEPNLRVAIVLKCAILAAGGAAIANQFVALSRLSNPSQGIKRGVTQLLIDNWGVRLVRIILPCSKLATEGILCPCSIRPDLDAD
jgi:hypothetical protein